MTINIAILDDSPMMEAFYKRQLGKEHELNIFTQPHQVLRKLIQNKPDLILLDWGFSTDKISLLKAIKRRRELNDIPLIVLTGNPSQHFRREGLKLGITDFLLKPFQPNELQYLIKDQLGVKMYSQ